MVKEATANYGSHGIITQHPSLGCQLGQHFLENTGMGLVETENMTAFGDSWASHPMQTSSKLPFELTHRADIFCILLLEACPADALLHHNNKLCLHTPKKLLLKDPLGHTLVGYLKHTSFWGPP